MNEGVELIIMNTAMATMLVDVCMCFYGWQCCGCMCFYGWKHVGLTAAWLYLPPKGHLLAVWQKRRYKPVDVLLAPDEILQEHLVASIFSH